MPYRALLVALFLGLAALPVRAQGVIDPFTLFPSPPAGGAPTIVSSAYAASFTTTGASSKTIGSAVSLIAGDIVVIAAVSEDGTAGMGLTEDGTQALTSHVSLTASTEVFIRSYVAVGSETVQFNVTGATSKYYGARAWHIRDASTVTNAVTGSGGSGVPNVNMTTGVDNSLIIMANGDWSAVSGTSTWRANAGAVTLLDNGVVAGAYGYHVAYHADAGTAGTYALGMTAPTGMDYQFGAVEVRP